MNKKILITFLILNIIDLITTYIFLSNHHGYEVTVFKDFIKYFGFFNASIISLVISIVFFIYTSYVIKETWLLFSIFILPYFYIIPNNLMLIFK